MRTLSLLVVIFFSGSVLAGGYPFTKETRLKNSHDYGPALEVADINGDGRPDIFALSLHKFSWFENKKKGKGRVLVERDIAPGFKEPYATALVDMDNDGDLDVVALARYAGISWFENQKKGKKWKQHTVRAKTDGRARKIGAGDVDGDGDIDLIVGGRGVAWIENEGSKFGEDQTVYDAKRSVYDMVVADFDGDKDPDVVAVAEVGDKKVLAYFSNNDGPFELEQLNARAPVELRVQQLDEGAVDLIVTYPHEVQLYLGDEDGLTHETSIGLDERVFYDAAAVGDFDNDNDLDVIKGSSNGPLLLITSKGDDEFDKLVLDPHPTQPRSVVPVDLDGDKNLDFVATYWAAGLRTHKIVWHQNRPKSAKKKSKKKKK